MATKMDPKMMAMMAAKARGGARPPMGGRGAMGGMGARPPMAPPGGGMPPPGGGMPPPGGGGAPPMMKKGGMPMVKKDGKKVPSFAADGKGAMNHGGMTKMASGGFVRAADGIAKQGKTKAKQIKMKSGGMAC